MQKARRHPTKGLRPLVSVWFQDLFHSVIHGSFHLSLTVLGLSGVFSLSGWSRQIQTGFHVPRPTQDTTIYYTYYLYEAITLYGPTFQ
jgi:hypothetical protein